jgi:nitrous oxidase accessory protein
MLAPWVESLAAVVALAGQGRPVTDTIVVGPGGSVPTITAALNQARVGDVVLVRAGTYRESTLTIRTAGVTLQGEGWPVIDGAQARAVVIITAPDVTVRGIVVTGTGESNLEDRAGIRARDAARCLIEHNRLRDNLFGVYLERSPSCVVRDNDVRSSGTSQTTSGNGIHLWQSPGARVERNYVTGHRDGIYFEFSSGGLTRGNTSERNQRYGLHFMYSDSCRYLENQFIANSAGVAVMYSRGITIAQNRFSDAWGGGAYGLLLKEILGGEISGNEFVRNSTGLFLEGATRLAVRDNEFVQNGWAARVLADATDNHFTGNRFSANAFDVTTNSRSANSTFEGNWWDAYRGYDLDRDGIGDVPFHPVRLFALVVERHPESLVLLRSPTIAVLDAAERVLPVLTPEALVDRKPLIRRPAAAKAPPRLPQ